MDKTENILNECREKYSDKYDYSLITEIKNKKDKQPIICPKHGIFYKSIEKHLLGQECPYCSRKKKYTTESFIDKLNKLPHCNEYSYEKVNYVNNRAKVIINCHHKDKNGNEHGYFEISPSHLISGEGCPKCRYLKSAASLRRSVEEVISQAREVHGDKYDYSLIKEYENDRIKYPIICPEHGVFYQAMNNHIKAKQGCPICGRKKCDENRKITFEEYVERANKVHDGKYTYVKETYIDQSHKVGIICPKHGLFYMNGSNHIHLGHSCPKCSYVHSKGEEELYEWLCEILGKEQVISHERTVLDGDELDIYLPKFKIGIEYNGLFWHSECNKPNDYHLIKTKRCNERGIRLFHIFDDEWLEKKEIIKSMLSNLCGLTKNKIYARKCIIKEVPFKESRDFINRNHLQGNCNSSIRIGLYYNEQLVSLMTFGKTRHFVGANNFEYELLRFCTELNTTVIGGASKIFNYFVKNFKPNSIVSYADRRWSNGNVYDKLGFTKYNESKPNYYYIIKNHRVYRFNMRKSVLMEKYGCPKEMTEREFCKSKGWFRIYDCGCLCFKW